GGVAGNAPPLHQHRHVGRDDGAYAAGSELAFPVDAGLGERAVLVVEAAGNVRAEDAVLDRQVAKLERSEDNVFGHDRASPASSATARSHTTPNSAGTKAAAGQCAQLPTMNSTSGPGVRSCAASSCSTTSVPCRIAPATVTPGMVAWRSTLGGANRHCATTASVADRTRRCGSLQSSRMRSNPRARLCTAMPVACTPARSPPTISASNARARLSRPLRMRNSERTGSRVCTAVLSVTAAAQLLLFDR